jgi:DNA-binding Lrp family transcriptional regulator
VSSSERKIDGLDSLDQDLLALLRVDARISTAEIAKRLGVSRGTVSNRLARLTKSGVIVGYTVLVKSDSLSTVVQAWTSIIVEGEKTRMVVEALLRDTAITGLYDTNGRWDLLAEIRAASFDELSTVLGRIRSIKGIGATETSIHLRTIRRLQ